MGYKAYSDSYLMSLTKAQIIELLRVAEHNFFTTEEALNNSAKAGTEIGEKFDKAKELLKSALEDMNDGGCKGSCKGCTNLKNHYCTDYDNYTWRFTDETLRLINDEK